MSDMQLAVGCVDLLEVLMFCTQQVYGTEPRQNQGRQVSIFKHNITMEHHVSTYIQHAADTIED